MKSFVETLSIRLIFTLIATIFICSITTEARPSETPPSDASNFDLEATLDTNLYNGNLSPHVIRQIQKCDMDIETMELCMRCAKVTKSEIVYPLCCDNEEGVKDWCHNYIYFGATPSPS